MNLLEKILSVQSELEVRKNKRNNFGKYDYRTKESILANLNPLLKEFKITQIIKDDIVIMLNEYWMKSSVFVYDTDKPNDPPMITYGYAKIPKEQKGMNDSQVTGSASSYAGKYALCNAWNIDDGSVDPDSFEQKKAAKAKTTNNAPAPKSDSPLPEFTLENISQKHKDGIKIKLDAGADEKEIKAILGRLYKFGTKAATIKVLDAIKG